MASKKDDDDITAIDVALAESEKKNYPGKKEQEPVRVKQVDTLAVSCFGGLGFGIACFFCGVTGWNLINFDSGALTAYFIFGGITQYLNGIFDFMRGNTTGASINMFFGIYNSTPFLKFVLLSKGIAPASDKVSEGLMSLIISISAFFFFLTNLRGPLLPKISTGFASLIFLFLSLNNFTEKEIFSRISGTFGLLNTVVMFYMVSSNLFCSIYDKNFLPLFYKGEKTYWNQKKES